MIPLSIPPEVAIEPAQPKLFQSSTHPLDSLPLIFPPLLDQAVGQALRWIPARCPNFDQFYFGTHLIHCSRSSQLSQFLDWLRQSLPFSPLPLCHFDNPPLVVIVADQLGLQWNLAGCPIYAQSHLSAHLIFGPGNSPQYGFFHSIGH